jgi:hypothetical protein
MSDMARRSGLRRHNYSGLKYSRSEMGDLSQGGGRGREEDCCLRQWR